MRGEAEPNVASVKTLMETNLASLMNTPTECVNNSVM